MNKTSDYKKYTKCRICKSKDIHKILNLGKLPLAGGFLKNLNKINQEKAYPLVLYFCRNCYLVQTNYVINKDILFKTYYYSSSTIQTLVDHFKEFALFISNKYPSKKFNFIAEIGSNDGIFLKQLNNKGYKTLGIDPASNIVKPLITQGINIINDYFTTHIAKKIIKDFGHADIVVSSNTLAHIEDINDVFNGIHLLLKPQGILIFENHYLVNLIKEIQYDMVYHEHQYYYSLLSLKEFVKLHNLEIFDAEKISTHAGSIRVFVQKKDSGNRPITKRFSKLLAEEKKLKLNNLSTYEKFEDKVKKNKVELRKLLLNLKRQKKKIVGYGASGRGTILSNFCELDSKILNYIVDDSPKKQGLYTPGNHLKIYPSNKLITDKPEYALLFAWSFTKEIVKRNKNYLKTGGKLITPLPKVAII